MTLPYHDKDDNELLTLYNDTGNNEWLGILLQRYTRMLFGVSMKYLKDEEKARDSVQQIFFKVINDISKYKVEYFKSWLYAVARNHCLMKLREKGHHAVEISDNILLPDSNSEDKDAAAEKEVSLTLLEKALALLNAEQKLCVTLFYLDKKTYREIAAVTGYNELQVKSNIQNGKRNLRIIMLRMQKNEH
jgi:RNA polymerase sigma-70 factor (ECF subfamily)